MAISGFGIPKLRKEKVELFPDNAVLTFHKLEGMGHARRISFNPKALELLDAIPGINSVNFAFDDISKLAYIAKNNDEDAVMMAKNASISNKKYYEYISKNYELDNEQDNYLALTDSIDLGETIAYELKTINPNEKVLEAPEPVKDVEIEHLVSEDTEDIEEEVKFEEVLMSTGPHNDNYKTEPLPHGHWDGVE